jgi:hypothetical protein
VTVKKEFAGRGDDTDTVSQYSDPGLMHSYAEKPAAAPVCPDPYLEEQSPAADEPQPSGDAEP